MNIVRIINHGERIADIIEEAKRLTFTNDCEYALVVLKTGERAMVAGERDGIELQVEQVRRLIGHTHPYSRPATGVPSDSDREALTILGQSSSWILEHGLLFKYTRD